MLKKIDILLIQPPMSFSSWYSGKSECLGLGMLAAILRNQGYSVKILDAFLLNMGLEEIVKAICEYPPQLLLGFTIQAMEMFQTTQQILSSLPIELRQVFTIVGGHAPTFWYKEILRECPDIDVVVRVEGEAAILELVEFVEGKRELSSITGIAFYTDDGIHLTPPRSLIENLDNLPFPHRDTLKFGIKNLGVSPVIQTSRGCFGHCNFCSLHSFYALHPGRKIRMRSAENVVEEIYFLYHNYGARYFVFADDTFITRSEYSRKRAKQIAQGILKRGLRIRFVIQLRSDAVDRETLTVLKEAGLCLATIGVESLDEESLALYGKNIKPVMNYWATHMLEDLNIRFRVCFINFNPFSTLEQLKKSNDYFRQLHGPHQCDHFFNRLYILHGTPMEDMLIKAGILTKNGYQLTYQFQDPQVEVIWPFCETYQKIFAPVKRDIGALWDWWFQQIDLPLPYFEKDLETIEHHLVDNHIYFMDQLISQVELGKNDMDDIIREMRQRTESLLVKLHVLIETVCRDARLEQIPLHFTYTYSSKDLNYGLSNDLLGEL